MRLPFCRHGKPSFSAIFAQKPHGDWLARHYLNGNAYQAGINHAVRSGLLTRTLSGYDGTAKTQVFAAEWRK